MDYKEEFKIIDTLEKAYVLGLIMADGNIFYNKRSGAYQTKIKLKQSDLKILNDITILFPFFTKPKLEKRSDNNNSYYIYKYSKQLFKDLENNGILQRKSYDNANNVFMPNLSDDLFFSYLLGLFDGDGTIKQDKKGRIRIEVIGKTKQLFKYIVNRLDSIGIKSDLRYRKDKDYYMIRISNKVYVKEIIKRFQKNTLCLDRKFKPYFNIDWSKIPGFDNRGKNYQILFVTTSKN